MENQPTNQIPAEQPAAPEQKKKSLSKFLIAGICLAVVLVIGGLGFFFASQQTTKSTAVADKVYHVGILSGLDFFLPAAESFKKEMAALGYIEGKNITYTLYKSNIEEVKEKESLKKFIDDKVDLVLSYPTEPSILAKNELKQANIPVIFAGAFTDQGGLVESVSNPGGNLTGVRYPGPDVAAKRLEILHELVPTAKTIWMPFLEGYPIVPKEIEAVEKQAKALGLTMIYFPAKGPQELEKELKARSQLPNIGFDAILLVPEPLAVSGNSFSIIDAFSVANKIPFGGTILPGSSSLFGYNPDNAEMGKLAAPLADKILKGTSAESLAVITPESYLYLNYKAATEFGLPVKEKLLNSAKEIIR